MKRLRNLDWEAIARITAAVVALILYFLHIVDEVILLAMALVLMALLLIRDFRREHNVERVGACAARTEMVVKDIHTALKAPDAVLIGQSGLRSTSEQFIRSGQARWSGLMSACSCSEDKYPLIPYCGRLLKIPELRSYNLSLTRARSIYGNPR